MKSKQGMQTGIKARLLRPLRRARNDKPLRGLAMMRGKTVASALLLCFGWLSLQPPSFGVLISESISLNSIKLAGPVPVTVTVTVTSDSHQGGAFAAAKVSKSRLQSDFARDVLKDGVQETGSVVTSGLFLGGSFVGQLTVPGLGQTIGGSLGAGLGGAVEGIFVSLIEKRQGEGFWFSVWRSIGRAAAKYRFGLPGASGMSLAEVFTRAADEMTETTGSDTALTGHLQTNGSEASAPAALVVPSSVGLTKSLKGFKTSSTFASRTTADLGTSFGTLLSSIYKEGAPNRSPWASDIHAQGPPPTGPPFETSFLYIGSHLPSSIRQISIKTIDIFLKNEIASPRFAGLAMTGKVWALSVQLLDREKRRLAGSGGGSRL